MENECCSQSDKKEKSKGRKSTNEKLALILIITVALNILVMGFFTFTVSRKLTSAINVIKPQEGKLTIILATDCDDCSDMSEEKQILTEQNIKFTDEKILTIDSKEAKKLIDKFDIKKLPVIVFESKKEINDKIASVLKDHVTLFSDSIIVWESVQPPYFEISSKTVKGFVDITYITDISCATCYDVVNVQRPILMRFALAIENEKVVDIKDSEGKELLEKYKITSVPTVVISGEIGEYKALADIWNQVGTIEGDGAYVFREAGAFGKDYKDLATGKVVKGKE